MIGNNWCDLLSEGSKLRLPCGENASFLRWGRRGISVGNHGQNICRLFHVLAQLLFTKNESELHYHQKRMCKLSQELPNCLLKVADFRKLGNFKKIPGKFRIDSKSPSGHSKGKFRQLCKKIAKTLL